MAASASASASASPSPSQEGGTAVGSRLSDGTFAGYTISVQDSLARGNALDWNCAGDNLLDSLGRLARVAGGDFDLIKTGAVAWDFRWYSGQRGTDRRATVIFSTTFGNMLTPEFEQIVSDERTVAIVGGQGQGSNRATRVRTGADFSSTRKTELFVDKRSESTTAGLDAGGDVALDKSRARQTYAFRVRQTPACAYGLHYCVGGAVGDLVTVRLGDRTTTQIIEGVDIGYGQDYETITPVLADA